MTIRNWRWVGCSATTYSVSLRWILLVVWVMVNSFVARILCFRIARMGYA
jgi:hypothetical protein